jgi:hypothetical protein
MQEPIGDRVKRLRNEIAELSEADQMDKMLRGIFNLAGGSFSALGDLPEEGCNVAPQRTHI